MWLIIISRQNLSKVKYFHSTSKHKFVCGFLKLTYWKLKMKSYFNVENMRFQFPMLPTHLDCAFALPHDKCGGLNVISLVVLGGWMLVPSWWYCLRRIRRHGLAKGSVSSRAGIDVSKDWCYFDHDLLVSSCCPCHYRLWICKPQINSSRQSWLGDTSWLRCFITATEKWLTQDTNSFYCPKKRSCVDWSVAGIEEESQS